jgi:hypothetical protein
MTINRNHRRVPVRLFAAMLAMILAVLGLSLSSANRAEAATCGGADPDGAGTTLYLITGTNCGVLSGTHKCVDFGNSSGVHAIECIQLEAEIDPSDSADLIVRAEGLFYCQGSSGYAACTGIYGNPEMTETSGSNLTSYTYTCGSYGGSACSDSVVNASTGWDYISSEVGSCVVFWGVDQEPTDIVLPDGTVEQYSSNIETGHVTICGDVVN